MLKLDWGVPLLARVLLREELGLEPTREEVAYTAKVRLAECKAVHPDKIKSAYMLDEEVSTRYCHLQQLRIHYLRLSFFFYSSPSENVYLDDEVCRLRQQLPARAK